MPQSARLSAGRGVQWLFGQCPNEQRFFYGGASLSGWCFGRFGRLVKMVALLVNIGAHIGGGDSSGDWWLMMVETEMHRSRVSSH